MNTLFSASLIPDSQATFCGTSTSWCPGAATSGVSLSAPHAFTPDGTYFHAVHG